MAIRDSREKGIAPRLNGHCGECFHQLDERFLSFFEAASVSGIA
jgi:hypothetical protein